MTNKEQFEKIVRSTITRQDPENLLIALGSTDFYFAPASTRYHDSYEGGLVTHSLLVHKELQHEVEGLGYSDETIAIVSLFHDLCKVGYYKTDMRNTKDENGKWIQVPYYTVDDKFPYGHGEKSVYLLQQHLKLTDQEATAIRWHMGAYSGQQDWKTLSDAYTQFPLALHLHISDMKATYLGGDRK